MSLLIREIRHRAPSMLAPLLCAMALVYFGYHGVQGDRGLLAWMKRTQQVEAVQQEIAQLRAERARIAHKVSLLRLDNLDLDLLDERVRVVLNLVHPDDLILVDPPTRD